MLINFWGNTDTARLRYNSERHNGIFDIPREFLGVLFWFQEILPYWGVQSLSLPFLILDSGKLTILGSSNFVPDLN